MANLQQINKKAQELRKAHPKMAWNEAQKKAAKQLSGVKVVSGVKKPRKKSVTKTERIVTVGAKPRSVYTHGLGIIKMIDKLEEKRKKAKSKIEKDLIQRVINSEHDKLDRLTKGAKK